MDARVARRGLRTSGIALWQAFLKIITVVLVVACSALVGPTATADPDGGPGKWADPAPGGAKPGGQAALYEQQIRGARQGQEYWVPFPETRQQPGFDIRTWKPTKETGVAFDGWDRNTRELLDAKAGRYAYLLDPKNAHWSKAQQGLEREARGQLRAASGTNTSVRWHFAEPAAQRHMNQFLAENGIKSTVTPPQKPPLFSAPGSPADPLGNARQGGVAAGPRPGGVDFSTLQLRYLSAADVGGEPGVEYSFKNAVGAGEDDPEAAREASDAFFVWLELDPSQFWVNLNPSQPDKVMDPVLARTDVGRVLLESDLQLKKTMTAAMDPDTRLGRDFWTRIVHGPDDDYCFWMRNWITPHPASVRPDGDELYILDAKLKVQSEAWQDGSSNACPGQTEQRRHYNETVIRDLLLPEMERVVNEGPEYADLRRVYLSRVAAEWYRQVSMQQDTQFGNLIGQGIVGPWELRDDWKPREVFDEYVSLVNATQAEITIDGVEYRFQYGGVDFSAAPATPMPAAEFANKHPALPDTVDDSVEQPTLDREDPTRIWFGGTSVVEKEQPPPPPPPTTRPPTSEPPSSHAPAPEGSAGPPDDLARTGAPVGLWLLAGLTLCIMGSVLLVARRRGGRSTDVS
jgi:restriction endonuclease fold toxin 5 of polymorphic toxin system